MSTDSATILRQLKIKSGAAKRVFKEHKSYIVEEEQQEIKLDKFVANGAEEWDIKNARRMLEESGKMITDSTRRLGATVQELRQLLLGAEKDPAIAKDPVVISAQEVLEEVSV